MWPSCLWRIRVSAFPRSIKAGFLSGFTAWIKAEASKRAERAWVVAIVKHIVLQHNGTIQVESEVNRGTVIRVTLPIRW